MKRESIGMRSRKPVREWYGKSVLLSFGQSVLTGCLLTDNFSLELPSGWLKALHFKSTFFFFVLFLFRETV